ncbi:hypothetical protein NGM10_08500 [Halorussus salilacus]|uniref:DUF7089 family protein n=1 Tax=Halorussus salilacus TaxID=2953750 RepID=UPI00209E8856|nr:hypothetical protein [Halorussus salilacus]USZ66774.1 hypothetical protein NGM10_08500 [Halorussus salilacus]
MFEERSLSGEVAGVRERHAPDALVLDCASDFETLPPAQAEDLGLLADSLAPLSYPEEWLPEDAPELLRRLASTDFTVGMPGDGSVAWTRQTVPPTVFVKARVQGSPEDFVDFLLAEALVEVGTDEPEHFLGFFGERYRDLDSALPFDSGSVYQIAAALYDAYLGLHTREVFADWADDRPRLFEAWRDAGERIEPRLEGLPSAMARDETDFADAAEFACSAVKHGLELPAPFAALDTEAYRDHGPAYAVTWAEKTFA